MGISVFPATGGGDGLSNDFVVDMDGTSNNTIPLPRQYPTGSYNLTFDVPDTTYDVYALNAAGSAVGYTNTANLVVSEGFEKIVVLGVTSTQKISFTFVGLVSDATALGQETGAGAYITSVSPTNLPAADNTTAVVGGNFSTAVAINFLSGTFVVPAKNIVRTNSTALVVTRPDGLLASLNPWTMRATNPGVIPPTGSNAHLFSGITGGSGVLFTTTSPLPNGTAGFAYAGTIVAVDPDGPVTYSITAGTFPGLSFNGATGVLSGTPTATGSAVIQALDQGGNSATGTFILPYITATGGSVTEDANFRYHTFNSTGTFVSFVNLGTATTQFIIAGGGGGGTLFDNSWGGGGGGGGFRAINGAINIGTYTITVGAGGASGSVGGNSIAPAGTAAGGGNGGRSQDTVVNGIAGGSGGGGARSSNQTGTGGAGNTPSTSPSQGNNGGNAASSNGGGGGGATSVGGVGDSRSGGAGTVVMSIERSRGGNGGSGSGNFFGQEGASNTGNGSGWNNTGGSGAVIIRIPK